LGLPLSDLEDVSGYAKEGGDIYSQVGEMPKDIVGIIRLKRMSYHGGVFKKFYPAKGGKK
jgi:hypothetical protein